MGTKGIIFQSTLPMRGATGRRADLLRIQRHFNPRSPCGERPRLRDCGLCRWHFNPRSPCGERPGILMGWKTGRNFNPRSPCGERPLPLFWRVRVTRFQSTLPMRGATGRVDRDRKGPGDFNPRSPCGERRCFRSVSLSRRLFQSTLPMRGATLR